jgi:hypothetical protein
VYDNGLNYVRGRTRHEEVQARLAREREEWDRQLRLRQEERLQAMRERMKERHEREQRMKEDIKRELVVPATEYEEKKKALEEEMEKIRQKQREVLLKAEEKLKEKMSTLQKVIEVKRADSIRSRRMIGGVVRRDTRKSSRRDSKTAALAVAYEMLKAEDLLRAVREMNPELEARRQAALEVSINKCPR